MNLNHIERGFPEATDILEDYLLARHKHAFIELLKDRTTNRNIFWGTTTYFSTHGEGYDEFDEITIDKITGINGQVLQPRALKEKAVQTKRSKDMAEVFTPAWICNIQNNLIDNAWFEEHGCGKPRTGGWFSNDERVWEVNSNRVFEEDDNKWQDYVKDIRLEITCGEAPYIVSRYDVADPTTNLIPLKWRIGFLDRKLRIVNENIPASNKKEWIKWAKIAMQSVYGYDWQGDNVLIARESLFITFIDYYEAKFYTRNVNWKLLKSIAEIISWNIWQMDGLKMVIPKSCHDIIEKYNVEATLWDDSHYLEKRFPCPGCKSGNVHAHNGQQCLIRDWEIVRSFGNKKKTLEEELEVGSIVLFHSFLQKGE